MALGLCWFYKIAITGYNFRVKLGRENGKHKRD